MYKSACFESCPIESSVEDASESAIEAMSGFVRRRGVGLNRDEASQSGRGLGQARGRCLKLKSGEFEGVGKVHLTERHIALEHHDPS
jgi:hypothetical protein